MRRTWTCGAVGVPKSKASKAPVPLHLLLAEFLRGWKEQTPYSQPGDWVFPSFRCKGKQPRTANMLVEDHLRPAAVAAGVLKEGEKVRFGFHNLRHSLQNRTYLQIALIAAARALPLVAINANAEKGRGLASAPESGWVISCNQNSKETHPPAGQPLPILASATAIESCRLRQSLLWIA